MSSVNSNWTVNQLMELINNRFWGKAIIHFQGGVVQRIVKEETIQPPDKPVKGVDYRTHVGK